MEHLPISGMAPLFAEAKSKGLWLFCNYQGMWFQPTELEAAQAKGDFRWGPASWSLRDPRERVAELERGVEYAQRALAEFRARLSK